jgi:hypothetical protein
LEERVAAVRRRLATAFDVDAAMVALSGADLVTLRLLEPEYVFAPLPVAKLREGIARAHVRAVRGKVLMSTRVVTPGVVWRWAHDVLEGWLPGFTDHEPGLGGQFRLRLLRQQRDERGLLVQVSTIHDHDPRVFRVGVEVEVA